jgi:membrane-associated phospholipid phosphatase
MSSFAHRLPQSSLVRIVVGFLLAAVVLATFGWVVTGPYKGVVAGFDSNLRYTMRQIQSPMWTAVFLAVTKLGSTIYLIIIGCAVGSILLFSRMFRPLLLFIIAMAGQAALDHSSKWFFARPRPATLISYKAVESSSFPSGHAIASLCMYGMVAWMVARELENPALKIAVWATAALLVFLIGTSRVYIGVHNPTDVVAGFLAGAIWLAAVMSADRKPL